MPYNTCHTRHTTQPHSLVAPPLDQCFACRGGIQADPCFCVSAFPAQCVSLPLSLCIWLRGSLFISHSKQVLMSSRFNAYLCTQSADKTVISTPVVAQRVTHIPGLDKECYPAQWHIPIAQNMALKVVWKHYQGPHNHQRSPGRSSSLHSREQKARQGHKSISMDGIRTPYLVPQGSLQLRHGQLVVLFERAVVWHVLLHCVICEVDCPVQAYHGVSDHYYMVVIVVITNT
jgi:hypothetical protein